MQNGDILKFLTTGRQSVRQTLAACNIGCQNRIFYILKCQSVSLMFWFVFFLIKATPFLITPIKNAIKIKICILRI